MYIYIFGHVCTHYIRKPIFLLNTVLKPVKLSSGLIIVVTHETE